MSPLLEACGLHAGYGGGGRVLHGVSLQCPAGQVTSLLGPNGSGKSTLAKALAGILVPAEGRILWEGRPLASWNTAERARTLGYLPQRLECQWPLSVERLATLGRLPHLAPWQQPDERDRAAVEAALAAADVAHLRARPIHSLSGGEALRAHLARVLAGEPRIIIVDEPLAPLDLRHQMEVACLLRRLADGGRAVLVVLHDLSMAARIATHAVLLDAGRVAASGTPRLVLTPENLRRVYQVEARVDWCGDPPSVTALSAAESAP